MTTRALALLAFTPALGCNKPPPAPTELDDLCSYMYAHVPDEEDEALAQGVLNLSRWLGENPEETAEGYTIHNLDQEMLDALDDRERSNLNLVGGTVTTDSPFPVDELTAALVTDDQTVVYPDTYESFTRTFTDGDGDCFVSHDCPRVEFENDSVANLPLGITVNTVTTAQWRWVETPDFGPVLVTRAWLQDPATINVDFFAVEAQYFLTVTYDLDGGAKRLQAVWADAQIIGIDVPEGTALNMLINTFKESDAALYAYVEGDTGG